jgi:ribosomal protein S18 acetylase RimI-like enzyme
VNISASHGRSAGRVELPLTSALVMIVRRAEPNEVEQAIDVWRAANPESGLRRHPERLRRWSLDRGAHLYIGVDGARVVGMALSVLGRADHGAGDVIPGQRHVIGVSVVPARRREGIARGMVRAVVDGARREACERVTLWVHVDNPAAQQLFQSFGFRPTGRRACDDAGVEMMQMELSFAREPASSH